jgi:energy-coupling factor transporter ATP-binding protein EcfA2
VFEELDLPLVTSKFVPPTPEDGFFGPTSRRVLPSTLVLISGGQGAGKTTFRKLLTGLSRETGKMSLADPIRERLCVWGEGRNINLDFRNTHQDYKDEPRRALNGHSIRDCLIATGEAAAKKDPWVWVKKAHLDLLAYFAAHETMVVDDLRKGSELDHFRKYHRPSEEGGFRVVHIHMEGGRPDYDYKLLRARADIWFTRSGGDAGGVDNENEEV